MKTRETKARFIELRAKGFSLAKIAEEISVSKPTLIKWCTELETEISNRKFEETEALLAEYNLMKIHRIKSYGEVLKQAYAEITTRPIKDLPTKELIRLIEVFDEKLMKEVHSIKYATGEFDDPDNGFGDLLTGKEKKIKLDT